ncbi:protein of unknown function [Paraburkholderia kururiensis]
MWHGFGRMAGTRAEMKIGYSVAIGGEFLFLRCQSGQPAKKYGVCYEQQRAIVTRPVFERTA